MTNRFARQFVIAFAAVAIAATTFVAPSSAAAAPGPAGQAAAGDSQTLTLRPDLSVTPLPMKVVNDKVWYMWKVTNIGGGSAKGVQLTRSAKVWSWYNGCCKGTIGDTYMHVGDVLKGQSFGVMLECPGTEYNSYCDNAMLDVKVTQGTPENTTINNWDAQGSTKDMTP
jgi:hypothetical protein